MKKKLISLTLLLFVFASGMVTAASINGTYDGFNIIKIFRDKKELKPADVPAIMYKGRTMVPLSLLRQLGVDVQWDSATYSVSVTMPVAKPVQKLTEAQLNELAKSVYKITAPKSATTMNQGSGFIVDGVMVTNFHVAGSSDYAQVTVDGMGQKVSEYEFANESLDLMGFSVVGGKSLPISTELPKVGDPVYAIGFPHGELKISEGVVRGFLKFAGEPDQISHSAFTTNGNSGGILVNGSGEVIGVVKSGATYDGENYGGAIPVKYLVDAMK